MAECGSGQWVYFSLWTVADIWFIVQQWVNCVNEVPVYSLCIQLVWLIRNRCRSRRERIRNEKTREELGAEETVIGKIKRRRLKWFGDVERMEGKRLPNAALHGHVRGDRSR